jgi:hypothetical protein
MNYERAFSGKAWGISSCVFTASCMVSAGAHFFCESFDITRPFPSHKPVKEPSWDFVWNRWLSQAFRNLGLDFLCPPLMQVLPCFTICGSTCKPWLRMQANITFAYYRVCARPSSLTILMVRSMTWPSSLGGAGCMQGLATRLVA